MGVRPLSSRADGFDARGLDMGQPDYSGEYVSHVEQLRAVYEQHSGIVVHWSHATALKSHRALGPLTWALLDRKPADVIAKLWGALEQVMREEHVRLWLQAPHTERRISPLPPWHRASFVWMPGWSPQRPRQH